MLIAQTFSSGSPAWKRVVDLTSAQTGTGETRSHFYFQINQAGRSQGRMKTIQCIGYEDHVCGIVVEKVGGRKRCPECAVIVKKKSTLLSMSTWRQNHPVERLENQRKWRQDHPENIQRYNLNRKQYYSENPEVYREQSRKWAREHPEYVSVHSHWRVIYNPKTTGHKNYEGMPFFDAWNPDKGGSFQAGADWIIANLGKRPESCSLNIIEHELGFVPGNLEWSGPKKQSANRMFRIIAQQKHEIKQLKERIQKLEQAA
jgi:hypothetical protein